MDIAKPRAATAAANESRTASSGVTAAGAGRGFPSASTAGSTQVRAGRRLLSARSIRITQGIWCCLFSAVAVLSLTTGALAQAPGRYGQKNIESPVVYPGVRLRITSADVLEDKSLRINMIVTSENDQQTSLELNLDKIQLVSDSLARVTATGKPEGSFMSDRNGRITIAGRDAIRLSLKFPPFQEETKRANLVFYFHGIAGQPDFTLRGIALFVDGK